MREQEMRTRVLWFLKARMRNMLMPAAVGIGLAVGGCTTTVGAYGGQMPDSSFPGPDTASQPNPDVADSSAADTEVAGADAREAASSADLADVSIGRDVPVYGIDMRPPDVRDASAEVADATMALDGGSIDAGADLGVITKYGVPIPDAGLDSARDLSGGTETLPPVRYAAVMPPDADDAPRAVPLYMAPPPQQT